VVQAVCCRYTAEQLRKPCHNLTVDIILPARVVCWVVTVSEVECSATSTSVEWCCHVLLDTLTGQCRHDDGISDEVTVSTMLPHFTPTKYDMVDRQWRH